MIFSIYNDVKLFTAKEKQTPLSCKVANKNNFKGGSSKFLTQFLHVCLIKDASLTEEASNLQP